MDRPGVQKMVSSPGCVTLCVNRLRPSRTTGIEQLLEGTPRGDGTRMINRASGNSAGTWCFLVSPRPSGHLSPSSRTTTRPRDPFGNTHTRTAILDGCRSASWRTKMKSSADGRCAWTWNTRTASTTWPGSADTCSFNPIRDGVSMDKPITVTKTWLLEIRTNCGPVT